MTDLDDWAARIRARIVDTFMAWEGGKFYVYYAGSSTQDTGLLDMGIQIGHATAVWDPAALDA